jgi:cytidine deaminase
MTHKIEYIISSLINKRLLNSSFGSFYHCSIIFTKKQGALYPLSYGENQIRGNKSIHAEVDAINRIKPKKQGKIQKVCLFVLRVNKSKEITISKPCKHCINQMKSLVSKNYKISDVFYSDKDGKIIKTSFTNLLLDPCKHISRIDRRKTSI